MAQQLGDQWRATGYLRIKQVSARDLPAADKNGKSDPYFIVKYVVIVLYQLHVRTAV